MFYKLTPAANQAQLWNFPLFFRVSNVPFFLIVCSSNLTLTFQDFFFSSENFAVAVM